MHRRLLALSRSRPPFPSSFFTQSPSCSGSSSSKSSLRSFGDSSRSRPPPSSRSRAGGSGNPGKRPEGNGSSSKAAANTSATDAGPSTETKIETGSQQRVRTTSGRTARTSTSRASSFSNTSGRATANEVNPVQAVWKPRSFIPLPILGAPPVQITQDAFYSGHRPLLEITVAQNRRRSISSSERKPMEIVGQSSAESQDDAEAQMMTSMDWNGDMPGEWDSYLVTEPEGVDPRWAEGTDKYLAALEHNIPPPVPSSSSRSTTAETTSKTIKRKQPSQRRKDIDYLFPIQAERRANEDLERKLAEEQSISAPSRIPSHRLKPHNTSSHHHQSMSGNAGGSGFETVFTSNGDLTSSSPGVRFLVSQLMKNQWSGLWDFEAVSKALQAALSKSADRGTTSNISPAKIVEKLSLTSRKQARLRSKAGRRKGGMTNMKPGTLEKMLTEALEGTGAQVTIVTMSKDGNMVSRQLSENSKEGKLKDDQRASSSMEKVSKQDRQAFQNEVRQVIRQVEKFKGFFDKSVDDSEFSNLTDKSSKSATGYPVSAAEAAHRRLEQRFGSSSSSSSSTPEDGKNVEFEVEWEGGAVLPSTSSISAEGARIVDASELDWVTEADSFSASEEMMIDARFSLVGPRVLQAIRGRSLNRTLRERLAMRGVHLVGSRVDMDSVKRKRRRRISKHKYKKRRKATRAERRRTGK